MSSFQLIIHADVNMFDIRAESFYNILTRSEWEWFAILDPNMDK